MNSDGLTEQELSEAIAAAVRAKQGKERLKEHWRNVLKPRATFDKWTAEEYLETMIDFFEEQGTSLVIDDDNRKVIDLLLWYFTRDQRFTEAGYDLNKGLLLYGPVGVGKSQLMNFFRSNQRASYVLADCSDIAALFKKSGEEGITQYFIDKEITTDHKWGHKFCGFCFDDLGIESDGRYFGATLNVMERIFDKRYRMRAETTTHVVTNLTAKQIQDRYGDRTKDRMREMMNSIQFPATAGSRRK